MPKIPDYTELWESRLVYCRACGTVFKASIVVPDDQCRTVYPQAGAIVHMSTGIPCRACGVRNDYQVTG